VSLGQVFVLCHIVSVIVAVGTNLTYPWWRRAADADATHLVFTLESVRLLDRRVANPAYGLVFVFGAFAVVTGDHTWTEGWLALSIALYVLVAVLGIAVLGPAVRSELAEAQVDPSSAAYAVARRRVRRLSPAPIAIVLVIVALMATKPF
jgi:uncharacterized membrane protein